MDFFLIVFCFMLAQILFFFANSWSLGLYLITVFQCTRHLLWVKYCPTWNCLCFPLSFVFFSSFFFFVSHFYPSQRRLWFKSCTILSPVCSFDTQWISTICWRNSKVWGNAWPTGKGQSVCLLFIILMFCENCLFHHFFISSSLNHI